MSGGPLELATLTAMIPEATAAAAPAIGASALGGAAFGSADMIAAGAAGGTGLLGGGAAAASGAAAADSLLPAMTDPLIENGLWDGVGAIPGTIESSGMTANPFTGGYDNLNWLQRGGNELIGGLETGSMNPMSFMKMFSQPQQRPQGGGGGMPRQQPQVQEVAPAYGQAPVGGSEEEEMKKRMAMMSLLGGQYGAA